VNNSLTPDNEIHLEQAIEALMASTGLLAVAKAASTRSGHHALQISIGESKHSSTFIPDFKNVDRFEALNIIKTKHASASKPAVLITPYLSRELAQHCRKIDLSFIDTAGNAYLRSTNLLVFVTGQPRKIDLIVKPHFQALTAAGLKIVFHLLTHSTAINTSYRAIQESTQVSLGSIAKIMEDLIARGYISAESQSSRRLIVAEKLVEEWAVHYPIKLRPKLFARRYTQVNSKGLNHFLKNANLSTHRAVWGGESAAAILTRHLVPERATIYLHHTGESLIQEHRLRADPFGEIELLNAFWQEDNNTSLTTAPPLVVYSDLLSAGDGRLNETAGLLRKQYLA
jgi:hypothetical protein